MRKRKYYAQSMCLCLALSLVSIPTCSIEARLAAEPIESSQSFIRGNNNSAKQAVLSNVLTKLTQKFFRFTRNTQTVETSSTQKIKTIQALLAKLKNKKIIIPASIVSIGISFIAILLFILKTQNNDNTGKPGPSGPTPSQIKEPTEIADTINTIDTIKTLETENISTSKTQALEKKEQKEDAINFQIIYKTLKRVNKTVKNNTKKLQSIHEKVNEEKIEKLEKQFEILQKKLKDVEQKQIEATKESSSEKIFIPEPAITNTTTSSTQEVIKETNILSPIPNSIEDDDYLIKDTRARNNPTLNRMPQGANNTQNITGIIEDIADTTNKKKFTLPNLFKTFTSCFKDPEKLNSKIQKTIDETGEVIFDEAMDMKTHLLEENSKNVMQKYLEEHDDPLMQRALKQMQET